MKNETIDLFLTYSKIQKSDTAWKICSELFSELYLEISSSFLGLNFFFF